MDDVNEQGERDNCSGGPPAYPQGGSWPHAPGEPGRGIGTNAEQETAAYRNPVQENVGNLADTIWNEPLQPLVGGPDEKTGKRRQQQDGGILERPPRSVEQKGDDPVLDEVKALHHVDIGIASGLDDREPDRPGHRRKESAVAEQPVLPNPQNGRNNRRGREHSNRTADDTNELAGEGRPNPAPDKSDERCREHEGRRDDDCQDEARTAERCPDRTRRVSRTAWCDARRCA